MRVIVADDVLLTREGIVRILEGAGVSVVGTARDVTELLDSVRDNAPGRRGGGHPHAAHPHR